MIRVLPMALKIGDRFTTGCATCKKAEREGQPTGEKNDYSGWRYAALEEFVHDHRVHGALNAHATEPASNGYLLMVAVRVGWCLSGG
jgi:hypothetical protein